MTPPESINNTTHPHAIASRGGKPNPSIADKYKKHHTRDKKMQHHSDLVHISTLT